MTVCMSRNGKRHTCCPGRLRRGTIMRITGPAARRKLSCERETPLMTLRTQVLTCHGVQEQESSGLSV